MVRPFPLLYDGLKRIEIWCGTRKVGDILAEQDGVPEGATIRDSAQLGP
jgi:hypothetical protein